MRRFVFLSVGFAIVAAACDSDRVSGTPSASTNVSIAATVLGRISGLDSVSIHIVNSGSSTAYLPPCGTQPLLLVQRFVDGVWTGGVENFACIASFTGPVQLAPGASIDIVRFLEAGRYRMTVAVAATTDLANPSTVISNAVDAP